MALKRLFVSLALALAVLAAIRPSRADGPRAALFADVTSSCGLDGVRGWRVAFADLDGDGAPDAVIDRSKVFLNRSGRLVAAGDLGPGANIVQLADVNDDGVPDLFFARHCTPRKQGWKDDGLRSELRLGDGKGGFVARPGSGLEKEAETTVAACFLDYDQDGLLDLFVGNEYVVYGESLEAYPDRLWRGRGDGTFEDVTERAGLLGVAEPGKPDSRRPTYGVTHCDWNEDGREDLLVMTYGRQANRLWRNDGGGHFTDVGPETGFDGDQDRSGTYPDEIKRRMGRPDEPPFRSHGNTFDAAVADFDGDGHLDVFLAEITHWWAGSSSDLSMLLVNKGPAGKFAFERRPDLIRRAHAERAWNQGDLHAGWLDVDNDGLLDLVIASSDYPDDQLLRLWHQTEDHRFEEWTDRLGFRWLNATDVSLADVDGDGATDLLVGTSHNRLTREQVASHSLNVGLFRNTCAAAAGNGFLTLRLAGGGKGKANRDAIGARVTVRIGGRRQTRIVQGGLGHAGHRDDLECRFGVGKATEVDELEVQWPDAARSVQVFEHVPASRHYVLVQGGELREGRAARRKRFY